MRDAIQRHVEVPLVCRLLRIPHGVAVLELGCGTGNALSVLRRVLRPSLLIGVDLMPGGGQVRGDVRSLPFADSSFDVVVDFGTCFHAGPASLTEVQRVLRPGGLLVHETPWAQRLAHPSHRVEPLDWSAEPHLRPEAGALLWRTRRRR